MPWVRSAVLRTGNFSSDTSRAATRRSSRALVERHGPMVFEICRGILGNCHDTEDAFQATFLVLVRQAGSIRSATRSRAGCSALPEDRCRCGSMRRGGGSTSGGQPRWRHDRTLTRHSPASGPCCARKWRGCREVPRSRRAVLLRGHTYEAAGRRLGRPIGTVKVRLSRARGLLLGRLTRRGLGRPAGVVAFGLRGGGRAGAVRTGSAYDPGGGAPRRFGGWPPGDAVFEKQTMTTALGAVAAVLAAGVVSVGAACLLTTECRRNGQCASRSAARRTYAVIACWCGLSKLGLSRRRCPGRRRGDRQYSRRPIRLAVLRPARGIGRCRPRRADEREGHRT